MADDQYIGIYDQYGRVYNYDEVKDTGLSLALVMVLYSGEPVSNVRAWVRDQELYIDGMPPEGIAAGEYYNCFAQYTIQPEDLLARYDVSVPYTVTYDDVDGISHSVNSEFTTKIERRPTEYALYFSFYDQNYNSLFPGYSIEITPPFDQPVTVSENVTITKSGTYTLRLSELSPGFSMSEDVFRSITIPTTVQEGEALGFAIKDDTALPPIVVPGGGSDDYMDLALTMQVPGQPWIWP